MPSHNQTSPFLLPNHKYHIPKPYLWRWHNKAISLPIQSTSHRGGGVSPPQHCESNANQRGNEIEFEIPLSSQFHPSAAKPANYLDSLRNCLTRSCYPLFALLIYSTELLICFKPSFPNLRSNISLSWAFSASMTFFSSSGDNCGCCCGSYLHPYCLFLISHGCFIRER